jgi:hypothetical protein
MGLALTSTMASQFAAVTLSHVTREYPNKQDHVLNGPSDVQSSRRLHPIFYGSFDWHGCVLAYWLLARIYRRFPGLPVAFEIRQLIDAHFTSQNVDAELAYLGQPLRSTFERPYGWAWLLMLSTELAHHTTLEGKRWSNALAPLADEFAPRFVDYLAKAAYPVRTGVHSNTAFALAGALEYAEIARNGSLEEVIREKALDWYGQDADCQAWEPSGEDFLSPALVEAECMRRVLAASVFAQWLDRFLPRLSAAQPACLFLPATVSDRTDGKIAHLDGLNFSRAWCLRSLARSLRTGDDFRELLLRTAEVHLESSLHHIADDYMGSHWLATYAALALDA